MGFVALTSFSTEYGFTSTIVGTVNSQSRGLLIRQPLREKPSMVVTFNRLETSTVDWLKRKPEVILTAPKVENYPGSDPVGSLSTSSERLSIFGILGILPSAEAEVTGFDKLLVEGRYLYDDEEDAILLSAGAAKALNVQVGDPLVWRFGALSAGFKLVGLLDDQGLSRITDLDGSQMIPKKYILRVEEGVVIEERVDPCEPSEVVVINLRTTSRLVSYPIFISRIDALVGESVDILPFARQIALEGDYWVWTAADQSVNFLGLHTTLRLRGYPFSSPGLL